MKQTRTSGGKSVSAGKTKNQSETNNSNNPTTIFLVAMLDITWQMAIVVLVPIIGGFELDKHISTTPFFTIVGFILAMAGTFVVVKRALKEYSGTSFNGLKGGK